MSVLVFQVNTMDILLTVIRAAVVVGITFLVDRLISRFIDSVGAERGLDKRSKRQVKTSVRYIVVAFAALAFMAAVGIDLAVVFAGAGVLAFAISFASKDIISNFLSGTFLIFEKDLSVGDMVKIEDTYGIVRLIALRTTQIKTFDDKIVIVPNSMMANSILWNMTSGSSVMFTSIVTRISLEEDLNRVIALMKNAIPDDCRQNIKGESDIRFEFQEVGERYLGYKVMMYFKVNAEQETWIKSKVQAQVTKALVEEKVQFHKEVP